MDVRQRYLRQAPQLHTLLVRCRFHMTGEPDKLHPGQMRILIILAEEGCCNQRTLMRELCCSAASVATSVKRLEKSGYVKKETDPDDQRSTRIALTEAGRELALESIQCMKKLETIQLAGFSQEELHQMVNYQDRMMENLKRFLESERTKGV